MEKTKKRAENERIARKAMREMSDEALEIMVGMLVRAAKEEQREDDCSDKFGKNCECK